MRAYNDEWFPKVVEAEYITFTQWSQTSSQNIPRGFLYIFVLLQENCILVIDIEYCNNALHISVLYVVVGVFLLLPVFLYPLKVCIYTKLYVTDQMR